MEQLPQYHVLECQCMDFVDKEGTGKRGRFWCLTSQASTLFAAFWGRVAEVQQRTCQSATKDQQNLS